MTSSLFGKNKDPNGGPVRDILLMSFGTTLRDRTFQYAGGFFTNPTKARDVLIEDLNRDGWDDVVICSTFGDAPRIYINQCNDPSSGNWLGLVDETDTRFPALLDPDTESGNLLIQFCAVAAGDLDKDGYVDLYFSNYTEVEGDIAKDVLLINDGNGVFTDESEARLGVLRNSAFGTAVQLIDMDRDNDRDIVKTSTLNEVSPWDLDSQDDKDGLGVFILFNLPDPNNSMLRGFFSDERIPMTNIPKHWQKIPSTDPYMFAVGYLDLINFRKGLYVVDDKDDYVRILGSSDDIIVDSFVPFQGIPIGDGVSNSPLIV